MDNVELRTMTHLSTFYNYLAIYRTIFTHYYVMCMHVRLGCAQ